MIQIPLKLLFEPMVMIDQGHRLLRRMRRSWVAMPSSRARTQPCAHYDALQIRK